jgi:hypothetical protein
MKMSYSPSRAIPTGEANMPSLECKNAAVLRGFSACLNLLPYNPSSLWRRLSSRDQIPISWALRTERNKLPPRAGDTDK